MKELTWDSHEDIALALNRRFPDVDPLSVRFTDLRRWVCELEDFVGDPKACTEAKLERIQMAWKEEWEEAEG
ncbi:MAG TPA: Fe-S cluster assembly protein IscX [Phycisphaerae bacterium]|nr:Fe-S cluster assembly protein IscX [Phycisphaerae bacterium]HNU45605.1 Fe-S cluster assembly protein IscX [Phycisphaerae bacterium]